MRLPMCVLERINITKMWYAIHSRVSSLNFTLFGRQMRFFLSGGRGSSDPPGRRGGPALVCVSASISEKPLQRLWLTHVGQASSVYKYTSGIIAYPIGPPFHPETPSARFVGSCAQAIEMNVT